MTAAPDKPLASIYTFNFVVRADSWDEVVTILKDELDIPRGRGVAYAGFG